jgi:hypothetical protein
MAGCNVQGGPPRSVDPRAEAQDGNPSLGSEERAIGEFQVDQVPFARVMRNHWGDQQGVVGGEGWNVDQLGVRVQWGSSFKSVAITAQPPWVAHCWAVLGGGTFQTRIVFATTRIQKS